MTNVSTVENKFSSVGKYLKILKAYQKYSLLQIRDDITLKGAVERYFYLAIQSTIELAEGAVSLKKYRKPSSYRETFEILIEEKMVPSALGQKLIKMTGFRNIIAHDYEKVDFAIVYESMKKNLVDIDKFLKIIRLKLLA